MNDDHLTPNEIATLMEALETWVKEPHSGALMGGLLGAMLAPKDGREEAMDFSKKQMAEAGTESTSRRERCILLQAKLIHMKQLAFMGQEMKP